MIHLDLSIQDIRSKIKTIIFEQTQIGLIIIDYLQLMQNSKSKLEIEFKNFHKLLVH
jgi:replicative DNA helicase